ncbi:MAG: hypothetical protein IJT98_06290 [Prevotella sp.]|nr:hypothetical protein [Prevotella sp.]
MTLHIFNPDHDLALASGQANFTSPHAGRQLRHDLGWLPVLWANEGIVLAAEDSIPAAMAKRYIKEGVRLMSPSKALKQELQDTDVCIEPWGWNAALKAYLLRIGVPEKAMPQDEKIEAIRRVSHRKTAAWLLPQLNPAQPIIAAKECCSELEARSLFETYGSLVLKAPWSSSGRGVRFITRPEAFKEPSLNGWLHNTIATQGSIMAEPYYNKQKDFAMEFVTDGQGNTYYTGLSLFQTGPGGSYTGNLIATEPAKQDILSRHVAPEQLCDIREQLCLLTGKLFEGMYQGPFGVDMMIVAGGMLHPCVELNLRRTMGHVAIALNNRLNPRADDEIIHTMHIEYCNYKYKLLIKRI